MRNIITWLGSCGLRCCTYTDCDTRANEYSFADKYFNSVANCNFDVDEYACTDEYGDEDYDSNTNASNASGLDKEKRSRYCLVSRLSRD